MPRSTKEAWLGPNAGDLREADVEDVPTKGQTVRVRGLAAAYSNQATSEALETVIGPKGEQTARVNTERLEVLQFVHGVIEPKFNLDEATHISRTFGPAFKKVIAKIDELSGIDKEAIEATEARFPVSGTGTNGSDLAPASPSGSGGPDVRVRARSGAGDDAG